MDQESRDKLNVLRYNTKTLGQESCWGQITVWMNNPMVTQMTRTLSYPADFSQVTEGDENEKDTANTREENCNTFTI